MSIESLYNSVFSLYRNSLDSATPDAIGGVSRTVSLVDSSIPCYFTPISFKEAVFFGKMNVQASHRLFTACNYEFITTDLVYINGSYYNVEYIEDAGGNRHHHIELLLKITKAPHIVYADSSSSDSSSSSSSSYSSSSSSSSSVDSSSSSSSHSSSSSSD